MARWTCPECKREFGRANQGHMCSPGMTLAEYFAQASPWEQPVFEAIHARVGSLDGELIVDPIDMGILLKNGPTFATLRAMKKWVAVGFSLPRHVPSPRTSRKVVDYGGKYYHVINIDDAGLVDDELLDWMEEAFYFAAGVIVDPDAGDDDDAGMVPDDVDVDF